MSSKALQENNAIILFGHPVAGSEKVSDEVSSLGLKLLRAAPSDMKWVCAPDIIQPRYSIFKSILPAFMRASIDGAGLSKSDDFLVTYEMFQNSIIPFSPPPLVMAWSTAPALEVLEQIRAKIGTMVTETVSGGKTAFLFKADIWGDYVRAREFKINVIAQAPYGSVNVTALMAARMIAVVLTALTHCIRYPAFADKEHETQFKLGSFRDGDAIDEIEDDDVLKAAVEDSQRTAFAAPMSYSDLEKTTDVPCWVISYKNLPKAITSVDITENFDQLPKDDGIYVPYVPQLSQQDPQAFPEFLRTFVVQSFGEDVESAISNCDEVARQWGLISKTEFGDEAAHYVTAVKMALQGQARPLPLIRQGRYVGAAILGAGFTIYMNGRWYRPVGSQDLQTAIQSSNSHSLALLEIAKMLGNPDARTAAVSAKSMLELRNIITGAFTKPENHDSILRLGGHLTFRESTRWSINPTTISFALKTIRDPSFSLVTADSHKFPIHHSMLLSSDTTAIVWSCFGSYAPSFRVPGGKEFPLEKDMEVTVENAKTGSSRVQKIVRVACRNKVLPEAIKDLREMADKRTIMNPIVQARIKQSQQNMDRFFTGDDGRAVLASLREFCNVSSTTSSSSNKRNIGDADEDKANKKRKVFDLSGW